MKIKLFIFFVIFMYMISLAFASVSDDASYLIAHWKMNDTYDYSGNGRNLTAVGTPDLVSGWDGTANSAWSYDGAEGHKTTGQYLNLTDSYTMCYWMNTDNPVTENTWFYYIGDYNWNTVRLNINTNEYSVSHYDGSFNMDGSTDGIENRWLFTCANGTQG